MNINSRAVVPSSSSSSSSSSAWGKPEAHADRHPSPSDRPFDPSRGGDWLTAGYVERLLQLDLPVFSGTRSMTRRKMIFTRSRRSIPQWYMGNRTCKGTRLRANREVAISYNPLSHHTSLCSSPSVFSLYTRCKPSSHGWRLRRTKGTQHPGRLPRSQAALAYTGSTCLFSFVFVFAVVGYIL